MDDEFDEEAFRQVLFENWEGDLNDSYQLFRNVSDHLLDKGWIVPSIVAGLIQTAKHLARDHEVSVGKDFFERSVADILAGGDGLHVRRGDGSDENV